VLRLINQKELDLQKSVYYSKHQGLAKKKVNVRSPLMQRSELSKDEKEETPTQMSSNDPSNFIPSLNELEDTVKRTAVFQNQGGDHQKNNLP